MEEGLNLSSKLLPLGNSIYQMSYRCQVRGGYIMEERNMKISFGKSGSGSISPRVSLPLSWLKRVGITPEDREVEIILDDDKEEIIIKKRK